MELPEWQSSYLNALLRSQEDRVSEFETVKHFATIAQEPANGVQELLLHRTIAGLENILDALELLEILRMTQWIAYEPRILARLGDTEAILRDRPELNGHFENLRERAGYTTYSLKDWRLIGDESDLNIAETSIWARNIISIQEILPEENLGKLDLAHLVSILDYAYNSDIRIFQIGVITFVAPDNRWAQTIHRILTAPYLEFRAKQPETDSLVLTSPASKWSPHWKINARPTEVSRWSIVEAHTGQKLVGLGSAEANDQISAVLAISGLLRDGIQLNPLDDVLVRPVNLSHPIWGFRRHQFSAAGTPFQVHDIRALALGFLEAMPSNRRVSIFRSRLALYFVARRWRQRSSASVVTSENGFYSKAVRAAKLLGQNKFNDLVAYIDDLEHRFEPIFRFFRMEATTALRLLRRINELPESAPGPTPTSDEVLCVTHASVPEQSGGYAIRAHGVLTSLREHRVKISAVTRPGFPHGVLTDASTVVVDEVPYRRLQATSVTREHGEIQHLYSFIEPFKALFRDYGVGIIHVRSTFLIALPALIAARELGLKVLYEVSGLWELVYQDREESSDLLKRSSFAELAETIAMKSVDQLVVMNEAVRQIAIERGVSDGRIRIAHNAVKVDEFVSVDPPKNEVFTVGYLGSFQDYEGLDDILDLIKLFRAKNVPIQVLMVGDGQQYERIRKRIATESLTDYITLTGRVPHDQVITYYDLMDVLVYPRRSTGATETITPLKPFEALALAKPVVVSDVEPLKEIVGANERGLVFESGNVEDLVRCILDLYDAPDLRVKIGQAGRQWVEKHRNWDSVVEVFRTAYRELVEMADSTT